MQLVGKTFKATLPSGEVSVIRVVDRISINGTYYLRFYKRGVIGLQKTNYYQLKRAIENLGAVPAVNHYQGTEWMQGIFNDTPSVTLADHLGRMRMTLSATTPVNQATPTAQWIST
jgi:N-methylhydantoinase B/oxoprolinase/acetone carboxylase alpha subunit